MYQSRGQLRHAQRAPPPEPQPPGIRLAPRMPDLPPHDMFPINGSKVDGKVGDGHDGEQPEEVVEVRPVDVVGDPPVAAAPRGDARHHGDERGADVVPQREGRHGEARAEAPHGVGRLVVEEFHLADEGEHLGRAHHHVLRHLPEDGHGQVLAVAVGAGVGVVHAVARDDAAALDLERAGGEHGGGEHEEADAHARQLGEAAVVARGAARERDDDAVVEGHPEHDAEGVEDGEHGGGHAEAAHGSSVLPWRTKVVPICVYAAAKTMPLAHTGSRRSTHLSSSTCVTVHSRHALGRALSSSDVSTAALSRNLLPDWRLLPAICYDDYSEIEQPASKTDLLVFCRCL
ncbi:LOW QUALITY PROTEIN: hypothetical protein U9M48_016817 [Paspalum notatum var. saurae]|uniref:Uncharacterized protein n=1 Tax=Paspalum notatum var. saurae TaxID=547442 RepID=A0AAQ3WNK1_PASNO